MHLADRCPADLPRFSPAATARGRLTSPKFSAPSRTVPRDRIYARIPLIKAHRLATDRRTFPVTVTSTVSTSAAPAASRWQDLRDRIRADPHHGLQTLQDDSRLDPVDTQILLAETYQQLGQYKVAHIIAGQAVAAVSRADTRRLLAARAVLADLACRLGGPTAMKPCHDYAHLAARHADPARIFLAGAVYAVASFNNINCVEGGTRLARLQQLAQTPRHREHPDAAAIFHAYTAMNHICRHRRHPYPGEPDPLPGGLLTTDLTQLAPTALTHFLRHTTVTHRCTRVRR
jgi:hypothetical protein